MCFSMNPTCACVHSDMQRLRSAWASATQSLTRGNVESREESFPHPEEGLSADLTQTLQPSGRKGFPDTSQTEWLCRFAFTHTSIHSFTCLWSQNSLLNIQNHRLSLREQSLPIACCVRKACFDSRCTKQVVQTALQTNLTVSMNSRLDWKIIFRFPRWVVQDDLIWMIH